MRPSYWTASSPGTEYPVLRDDLQVDVAIVGGGIVGITAAHLLRQTGRSVALLEARRIAAQVTGYTTAKITSLHRSIYSTLASSFGEETARLYGQSNEAALAWMGRTIEAGGIDCGFERTSAYTYGLDEDELAQLREEAEIAAQLGLPASFVTEAKAPFPIGGAVCFSNQAQFHPYRYLLALAEGIPGDGSHVFENTRVLDVEEGEARHSVVTEHARVTARDVVVATNLPILDRGGYFAVAFPMSHVALSAQLDGEPLLDGMFISLGEPTRSVRLHRGAEGPVLIATGAGFKTGQGDAVALARDLEQWVRQHFSVRSVDHCWCNEDFSSKDRIPYIGRLTSRSERVWIATAFGAWGMTGGTLAAMILSDLIQDIPNPWARIYDSTRIGLTRGTAEFARENLNVAKEWVSGRIGAAERRSLDSLAPGEATILKGDDGRIAAYRDEAGSLHLVSPVCTHMGCTVAWNALSRTWDCPCHGSRFEPDGSVLFGPAVSALGRIDLDA